jgi:hypothetical protein
VGLDTLSFVDVVCLVGLMDDDAIKFRFNGVDQETDLALFDVEDFREILGGSNKIEMKARKLHTLGSYIKRL